MHGRTLPQMQAEGDRATVAGMKPITLELDTSEASAKLKELRVEVERIDALMDATLAKAAAVKAKLSEGDVGAVKAGVVAWLKSVGAVGVASELERSAGIPWEPPPPPG